MDININIDITPPLPNIYTSYDSKYNIKDKINNAFNISADSTIFIFNLNSSINIKYNDPNFMLYGVKIEGETYNLPSINYYNNNNNMTINNNYDIVSTSSTMTTDIKNMLTLIGYTDNITVPTNTLFYRYIKTYDFNKKVSSFIHYLYFYSDGAQINNYNKYINYNDALINVYVYPYINEFVFTESVPINYEPSFISSNSLKYENLNFDNIELSSYNNKLDFTYFSNNVTIPKLKLLSVYNKYIQRYKLINGINISLHELNVSNGSNGSNGVNISQFKMEYNKKNKNYNNVCDTNSITYNNKLAYINSKNNNTESSNSLNTYTLFNNNILYQYKLLENYTINSYIDVMSHEDNLQIVNNYLRKILILIDPQIINPDYVNTVSIKIENILNNKNEFTFSLTNKIIIVKKNDINYSDTNTYYIDRYKITYQNNYIILLNIAFYNSFNIYIRNIFSITNYNSLAYVNLTYINNTFSMYPSLTNTYNNDFVAIYNEFINLNFSNTSYYSYIINYNGGGDGNYNGGRDSKYIVNNFSSNISNIKQDAYKNYNNVLVEKVNNFITDVIITHLNFYNYTENVYRMDSLLSLYYTFDNKIDTHLIDYYDHDHDHEPNQYLPVGFYKVFYYTNKAPKYDLLVQSIENDELNKEVIDNGIPGILENNFCLLIKINTITEFYLAVCNKNREIYVQTTGKILIMKLFNYENGDIINPVPLSMNLIFNNYFNFCTLTIITEVFKYKNASNTLKIKNIEVSTYPYDSEIYNYDELCYSGSGGVIGCGGGLVNIDKYDERSVIILFNILIYLKRILYYKMVNYDNTNINRITLINSKNRYINIIYPLVSINNSNIDDIRKAIQIISNAFINVSNKSEFKSMSNTYKIFTEIERSLLLLDSEITNKNNLYKTLLYLYSPNINYNYVITPENQEIINSNIFNLNDSEEKIFINSSISIITEPQLLIFIDLINKIFIDQDVNEINAVVNGVDGVNGVDEVNAVVNGVNAVVNGVDGVNGVNGVGSVYISSLLFSNNKVYVYNYITNTVTLLLYSNESNIDIYNNVYIDLIKIILTNDILE
jgi:hypothetical protein